MIGCSNTLDHLPYGPLGNASDHANPRAIFAREAENYGAKLHALGTLVSVGRGRVQTVGGPNPPSRICGGSVATRAEWPIRQLDGSRGALR